MVSRDPLSPEPVSFPADPLPVAREKVDGRRVRVAGRTWLQFAGCDYLGLGRHPAVAAAAREAATRFGLGVAASRTTTGNHPLYEALEAALTSFARSPTALLTGAGYLANLAVAQVLAGRVGAVWIDEQAHPALFDAARLGEASVRTFRHRDPDDLRRRLRRSRRRGRVAVLTDGVFPLTGEVAPLAGLLEVLPPDGVLWVDDAHGLGVLGTTGAGTPEAAGAAVVEDARLIRTASLSKALGGHGGVILGPAWLREEVIRRSRLFRASTPPPLPAAAGVLAAVRWLQREDGLLAQLRQRIALARRAFARLDLPVPETATPVLSLRAASSARAAAIQSALAAEGILAEPANYPGTEQGGLFRFAISRAHTPGDIRRLERGLASGLRSAASSP
ncbi:MAG: pyridoxal phosphate-dependent aminotransferase family protein [Verrucomicrobia bacterium]|nr:MAG: pyridoxal phosphate-dependent aminotransferase family protein [Verrucomicrobiota bacterium]RME91745.1 MAG: pyridoxal phosphate-dependent aminotransferase family protein [Verrucomicrobiota bacterium]